MPESEKTDQTVLPSTEGDSIMEEVGSDVDAIRIALVVVGFTWQLGGGAVKRQIGKQ